MIEPQLRAKHSLPMAHRRYPIEPFVATHTAHASMLGPCPRGIAHETG